MVKTNSALPLHNMYVWGRSSDHGFEKEKNKEREREEQRVCDNATGDKREIATVFLFDGMCVGEDFCVCYFFMMFVQKSFKRVESE